MILDAANTSDDSGEFVANGTTATWIDYNSPQGGENFQGEPLNLLGTPFDGSDRKFIYARTHRGDYRFDRLDFQVTIAQVPEPGTAGIFAISLAGLFIRRKTIGPTNSFSSEATPYSHEFICESYALNFFV